MVREASFDLTDGELDGEAASVVPEEGTGLDQSAVQQPRGVLRSGRVLTFGWGARKLLQGERRNACWRGFRDGFTHKLEAAAFAPPVLDTEGTFSLASFDRHAARPPPPPLAAAHARCFAAAGHRRQPSGVMVLFITTRNILLRSPVLQRDAASTPSI